MRSYVFKNNKDEHRLIVEAKNIKKAKYKVEKIVKECGFKTDIKWKPSKRK